MSVLASLNDRLWPILEKLKLADFFDKHGIPPIAFPIVIIAIIALLLLILLSGPAGQQESLCGNGTCDNETESVVSCPEDCARPASTNKVIVEILSDVSADIEVSLEDSSGTFIQKFSGRSNKYTFVGVSSRSVKAIVKCLQSGEVKESSSTNVEGTTTIPITLPSNFFGTAPQPAKGTLKVALKDSITQGPVSGRVTVVIPNGASHTQVASKQVSGTDYFSVDANRWYAIIVQADGYALYDNRANPIKIDANQERQLDIPLQPMAVRQPATLSVCVTDEGGNLMTGLVALSSIAGAQLSEQALSNGCAEFELESGDSVQISASSLPSGCTNANGQMNLASGANSYNLSVTCGNSTGYARVKVLSANGTAVTSSATITMWYANGSQIFGTGTAHALAIGPENYTESLLVRSSEDFYYVITGVTGYSTATSDDYTVSAGENKSITITLQAPPGPTYNFTFQASYPAQVRISTNFTATISSVKYGPAFVTNTCNLSVSFAGAACNVTNGSAWTAICPAGATPGAKDLSVSATYSGHTGSRTYSLSVLAAGPTGYFELIPHALTDTTPPMTIEFDIKFNGTPLDSLTDSSVTVKYDAGGVSIPNQPSLTGGNGLYSMAVDSPYPGQHTANIYLMKALANIYEQNFTYSFTSEPASVKVISTQTITPQILEPGETYIIYATMKYNNAEIAGLSNLYLTAEGQRTALSWDGSAHAYTCSMAAPNSEGIYSIKFELDYQQIALKDIYVVDTTKSQAASCDISDCQNVQEVRKCVYRHRYETPPMYSEPDTIDCIEQGMPYDSGIAHCTGATADRGDWAKSCKLDSADVSSMSSFLNGVIDQIERNTYAGCGDMDNDGDVDESDKTCLNNIVSGKWIGDKGDGSCSSQLKGGFCFDIDDDLPGDFDGNDNFDSNDTAIMQKIMSAVTAGVAVNSEILAVADFDQSTAINTIDEACLTAIAGGADISDDCLKIYNFTCPADAGDITGDGNVDELDLLLMRWAADGRISCVRNCTDINYDGICDESDYLCVEAIFNGDVADAEEYCTNCIADMMAYGTETDSESGETFYMRYTENEICHDGLDNNCDDKIDTEDSRCGPCGESTPCDTQYDIDGDPETYDITSCAWTSFDAGGGTGWHWLIPETDLEMECLTCEHVEEGRVMQCGSRVRYCYPICDTAYANRIAYWNDAPEMDCGTYISFNAEFDFTNGVACASDACTALKGCDCGEQNTTGCPVGYSGIVPAVTHYGPEGESVSADGSDTCCFPYVCPACGYGVNEGAQVTDACKSCGGGGGW